MHADFASLVSMIVVIVLNVREDVYYVLEFFELGHNIITSFLLEICTDISSFK